MAAFGRSSHYPTPMPVVEIACRECNQPLNFLFGVDDKRSGAKLKIGNCGNTNCKMLNILILSSLDWE